VATDGEFEDTRMFIRFDSIHERDRQNGGTDGRTPHDGIGRACIALRDNIADSL